MEVVVDCCVLQAALSTTPHIDALAFVMKLVADPHVIMVDHDHHIEQEYARYFKRVSPLYDVVVSRLLTTPRKKSYADGRLNSAWKRKLNALSCHPDDRPYIGVAARSPDHRLTSNDGRSILDPDIRTYLESELGLSVFGLPEIGQALLP
jgi:hypothetical protein